MIISIEIIKIIIIIILTWDGGVETAKLSLPPPILIIIINIISIIFIIIIVILIMFIIIIIINIITFILTWDGGKEPILCTGTRGGTEYYREL